MSRDQYRKLIATLTTCVKDCNYCVAACLEEDDVKSLTECIKVCLDCKEICELAASYVARNSERAPLVLNLCADICDVCAAECGKYMHHMDHCRRCAEICK